MLLPLSILLGSFWYLDQQKQKVPVEPEEPKMRPQPKYTSAAISLVTHFNEKIGAREFLPSAMGDAIKALESSALELVPIRRGPSDILIYRLVPLAWGAEKAIDSIPKARLKGVYVLASLSLALSDPRETELLLLFGGKTAVKYANENSAFAVMACPDVKPVVEAVEPEIEQPKKHIPRSRAVKESANGTAKVESTESFPAPVEENV